MTEQLNLLLDTPDSTIVSGADRFAECRKRVAQRCGGHHEKGPLFAGLHISRWRCCTDCPNKAELNPEGF